MFKNEVDKLKTCWFIIILVIYSGVSIYLTANSYSLLNSNVGGFVDVASNWQAKAIIDITTTTSYCPAGFEDAYDFNWPGSKQFCYCDNVSYYTRRYYGMNDGTSTGACNYTQINAGCQQANSQAAQSLNAWSTIDGTPNKICVQRSQESWSDMAPSSGSSCPAGTKKCGFSADNVFCTKGSVCPINDIQLESVYIYDSNGTYSNCNSANNCTVFAKNGTQAKVLKYKRGDAFDALPTAQFRITEYSVCRDSSEDNVTPYRTQFRFLNKVKSACSQLGTSMWNLTTSVSEAQLFSQNGLTNTIKYLNNYGYYSSGRSGADYTYSIYSRSYVPWNTGCRSKMSQVVNYSDKMQTLKSVQGWFLTTTIIAGICLGIILPCMLCNTMNNRFEWYAPDSTRHMRKGMRNCGRMFNLIVKITQLPLQFYAIIVSLSTKGFFTDLASGNCSSNEMNNTLNSMGSSLSTVLKDNLLNLALIFVMFGVGWFFFLEKKIRENLDDSKQDSGVSMIQPAQNVVIQPVQTHVVVQPNPVFTTTTVVNPGFVPVQQFPQANVVFHQQPGVVFQQQGFPTNNGFQNNGFPHNNGFQNNKF